MVGSGPCEGGAGQTHVLGIIMNGVNLAIYDAGTALARCAARYLGFMCRLSRPRCLASVTRSCQFDGTFILGRESRGMVFRGI